MTALHKNNVSMTVSGTPGTGTITLGSASSGSQSFATAYGANATVDVRITDGTAWEVARNCTYTHSGTTLTRGTLEESSTGSAISLTSSAVVSVVMAAEKGNTLERLIVGGFSAYGDASTQITLGTASTTLVSSAAKTVVYDTDSAFNSTTGIWFPSKAGLYTIYGSAIATGGSFGDGQTLAVYCEHSTDGSTWSDVAKRALLWRGISGASNVSIGGSGSYIVSVNGSTDRFRLSCYYSGSSGAVYVPGSAANTDWIRFSAKYIGEIA